MSEFEFTVKKIAVFVPVSCCVAETCSPSDHPPAPKVPWRKRVHWTVSAWWYDHAPRVHFGPCDHEGCM